jgi:hypothetical protein
MPTAKSSELPAKAPKRTGRAGIGPKEDGPDREAPEPLEKVLAEPKQKRLPTMEDNKLADLEAAAERYAEIRDRRMALTDEEVGLKASLLTIMKRHSKVSYKRDGIEVNIVVKDETVRVKIKHDAKE